jgi:hypothetical protein
MRCATSAAANGDVVIRGCYHEPTSLRNFQGLGTGFHLPKLISAGKFGRECTGRCWQDLPPPPALIRAVAWYRHKRDRLKPSGRGAVRRGMCSIKVLLHTVTSYYSTSVCTGLYCSGTEDRPVCGLQYLPRTLTRLLQSRCILCMLYLLDCTLLHYIYAPNNTGEWAPEA